eukprot:359441-Chlamydomonas_euryale.AAC.5
MECRGRARAALAPNPVRGSTAARPRVHTQPGVDCPPLSLTGQMTAKGHEPWQWWSCHPAVAPAGACCTPPHTHVLKKSAQLPAGLSAAS